MNLRWCLTALTLVALFVVPTITLWAVGVPVLLAVVAGGLVPGLVEGVGVLGSGSRSR